MSKDYYNILGVPRTATNDEIKRAYRQLAHQYHPDKSGGDDRKFKEINEAYQILGNDQKRQQYDQFGTIFGQPGFSAQGGPTSGWDFSDQGVNPEDMFKGFSFRGGRVFDWEDFSDVFDDVLFRFGFGRKRRSKNILINLEIGLKDALKGAEKEIRLNDLGIKLKIKLKLPKNLSKEEKELLKKLRKGV